MGVAIAAGLIMFWAMSLMIASFTAAQDTKVLIYQRIGAAILTVGAFTLLYVAAT